MTRQLGPIRGELTVPWQGQIWVDRGLIGGEVLLIRHVRRHALVRFDLVSKVSQ